MGRNQRAEVRMTPEEISAFVSAQRTATLITLGPGGHPHAVAMWFAVIDGDLWFETKAKAQKAVNIGRDPRATVLIEDGETYDVLRGVSMEGRAELVDDADALWKVGVDMWERYHGPYSEEVKPLVETMLHKRVAVRLHVDRTRSWDHRKLGLPPMPLGGTTAP
ncbi:PPOX class probable F420-dependent enzyme [Saccharopolyspora antimicrobica]|uniref:PPOX class probable F420-dependent enzyme n=1 Tax=Saccharopolyspora antimicrobica TaxID=455193 RepID=A0A1I5CP88_9PSEU|nr:PPOX class F420-dependent oxidoreductase [Saccharopolyspora antimicrobica]RKT88794.1 PPOX class probable F420-dependent enzyme [Saccharopolyspora antimicrobica]SFN88809.1 PPOX class probable F420-dependent enzyme [Saccharopolyspora antimicrobica]